MIMRAIGRLIIVPLAFLVSALTAVAVLLTLGSERITHAMHGRTGEAAIEAMFELMRGGVALIGAATIVPALLVVIVGEVARIRSAYYYVLGGGASLAAVPLIARLGQAAGAGTLPATSLWQVFATAGFLGGLVYWLLAGRRS